MKTNYLYFVFLISINTFCQTANFSSDTYTITGKDLETNIYEKDSTANALVIYEIGNSYVDKNTFDLTTEFQRKLKILNKKGFDKATIEIYLYNNGKKKEKIKDLIATTSNSTNGKVVKTKLKSSEIFEEKYNANFTLIKFTMPNIQEGSVINYSYTITSPFMYKYRGWEFQSDIPKLYSEYRASIPANYEYHIKLVGELPLLKNESVRKKRCLDGGNGAYADCMNTIYVMKDIPPFIEEDYMTTKDNYLSRVEYELSIFRGFDGSVDNITKTWKAADHELKIDENIGRQFNKNVSAKTLLSPEIIAEENGFLKAKKIHAFVLENYTWNGKHISGGGSVKDLIKEKSGNASQINILLHNLLNESDIQAKPILLSTRNNGLPTKIYPVISDFNYLIVQVTIGRQNYLLDATDKYLAFGQIPYKCLNQYGRLLDFKEGSEWINLEVDKTSIINYRAELSLNENQTITGTINAETTGYHSLTEKQSYFKNPSQHLKKYQDKYTNLEISNLNVTTSDINSYKFKEDFEIKYLTENIGENIYINPFLFKFFSENPFKLQERTYPIDFGYKDVYSYTLKIQIDDEYEVIEQPTDVTTNLPNNAGQLIFTSSIKDGAILMYFKLSFKQAIYFREFYPYLKTLMNQVLDIQNNSIIVLKKK